MRAVVPREGSFFLGFETHLNLVCPLTHAPKAIDHALLPLIIWLSLRQLAPQGTMSFVQTALELDELLPDARERI